MFGLKLRNRRIIIIIIIIISAVCNKWPKQTADERNE